MEGMGEVVEEMPSTHQVMSIYSPGGGVEMTRLPLLDTNPVGANLEFLRICFPAGTRIHQALLPSDASSSVTPRVLRVEAPRRTSNDPVRAAWRTDRTAVPPSLLVGFEAQTDEPATGWFCGQTNKPHAQASVVSRHLALASPRLLLLFLHHADRT